MGYVSLPEGKRIKISQYQGTFGRVRGPGPRNVYESHGEKLSSTLGCLGKCHKGFLAGA